jgi:hypothetical protein
MVIESGPSAVRIAEALKADEDHRAGPCPVGERFLLDQFALERCKERFGHHVVGAISD